MFWKSSESPDVFGHVSVLYCGAGCAFQDVLMVISFSWALVPIRACAWSTPFYLGIKLDWKIHSRSSPTALQQTSHATAYLK